MENLKDFKIDCLDKGFVQYVDHMGTDLTVVNAARVSFNKVSTELTDRDIQLLDYLAEHEHTAPYRHCYVTLRVKAPIFCFRQIMKHRIASDFNEVSGRYVDLNDVDIFVPDTFRLQAKVNKQGSEGELDETNETYALGRYLNACRESINSYNDMIRVGVCREQARCVLPLAMYSEVIWTLSLQSMAHFIRLRTDSHAQKETQEYGHAVSEIGMKLFPNALGTLLRVMRESSN